MYSSFAPCTYPSYGGSTFKSLSKHWFNASYEVLPQDLLIDFDCVPRQEVNIDGAGLMKSAFNSCQDEVGEGDAKTFKYIIYVA